MHFTARLPSQTINQRKLKVYILAWSWEWYIKISNFIII